MVRRWREGPSAHLCHELNSLFVLQKTQLHSSGLRPTVKDCRGDFLPGNCLLFQDFLRVFQFTHSRCAAAVSAMTPALGGCCWFSADGSDPEVFTRRALHRGSSPATSLADISDVSCSVFVPFMISLAAALSRSVRSELHQCWSCWPKVQSCSGEQQRGRAGAEQGQREAERGRAGESRGRER